MIELSPELKKFYDEWRFLSHDQREAVLNVMKTMRNKSLADD